MFKTAIIICFVFIISFSSMSNILFAKAMGGDKPYISEVWAGNSNMANKCTNKQTKTETSLGLCSIDFWVEITNPSSSPLSLNGYTFDFTANKTSSINDECASTTNKAKPIYCNGSPVDKYNPNAIIPANSQIVFKQRYGDSLIEGAMFVSMINDLGLGYDYQLPLTYRQAVSKSNYSIGLFSPSGEFVDSYSSPLNSGNSSNEYCIIDGKKTLVTGITTTQVREKQFTMSPGKPNNCPTKVTNTPILPPKNNNQEKGEDSNQTNKLPNGNQENVALDSNVFKGGSETQTNTGKQGNKVSDVRPQFTDTTPTTTVTNIVVNTIKVIEPVPIILPKKVNVDNFVPPENKKIVPVQIITPSVTDVIKPIIPKENQFAQGLKETILKVDLQTQPIVQPIYKAATQQPVKAKANTPNTSTFAQLAFRESDNAIQKNLTQSIVNQTKTIEIVDQSKPKFFGMPLTKSVTVDMHSMKSNFIYFDIALLLFLISKNLVNNRKYFFKIWELARGYITN